MISLCGNISKGGAFTIALTLSFTVHVNLSISGTCKPFDFWDMFVPASDVYIYALQLRYIQIVGHLVYV